MNFAERENLEMIRDLVAVNQDRYTGYRSIATYLDESKDQRVLALIEKTMQQSQQYKSQLIPFAYPEQEEGFQPMLEKHIPWPIPTNGGIQLLGQTELLSICITAENETLNVYELALKNTEIVDQSLARMIDSQREGLIQTIDELRKLCPDDSAREQPATKNLKF